MIQNVNLIFIKNHDYITHFVIGSNLSLIMVILLCVNFIFLGSGYSAFKWNYNIYR